jgi:NAD(P)-dependent dehydrogenase (short-subunit alcohol dehydrogenase family)
MSFISKKVIVVTGANRGIGYGIIESFCKISTNNTLVLTSRNKEKGKQALDQLKSLYPNSRDNLFLEELDVSDKGSITDFINRFTQNYRFANILYNNAAILNRNPPTDKAVREKDIQDTFRTNVWGLMDLTEEMIPYIRDGGHIINMSTELGFMTFSKTWKERFLDLNLAYEDLDELYKEYHDAYLNNKLDETGWQDNKKDYGCYPTSKVFVNAYTRMLSKRLYTGGNNIKVNAVTPGWCNTEMGGGTAPRDYMKGAETPVWLASFPEEKKEELTGGFYSDKKRLSLSR